MKAKTFIITENSESINALKTIRMFTDKLEEDFYNWKWIVITAHNCLQNFMVSSLRNGNNLNVLEEKLSKNWFEEFAKRVNSNIECWKTPREKLDKFLYLYKKIKSDKMLMFTISKKLEADINKDEAMEWLNLHRNNFIHFVPSTFEINVIHFPKRMILIMEIMKFLVLESGNILWLNDEDKVQSEKWINELIVSFRKLHQSYSSMSSTT